MKEKEFYDHEYLLRQRNYPMYLALITVPLVVVLDKKRRNQITLGFEISLILRNRWALNE